MGILGYLLLLTSVAVGACRAGFDAPGSARPTVVPRVRLDEALIVSDRNSEVFTGECNDALDVVLSDGESLPCDIGRFTYETSEEATDGVRFYTFRQASGEAVSEVTGRWRRVTRPPELALDETTIRNSSDTATFAGDCESVYGRIEVLAPSGTSTVPCIADRFEFEASGTVDGRRDYSFSVTGPTGLTASVSGSWTRDSGLPVLTLDEPELYSRDDSVSFSGDCESSSGGVRYADGGVAGEVPCVADRFQYTTATQSADGEFEVIFYHGIAPSESTAVATWYRQTAPLVLPIDEVQPASGFGDSLAVVGDYLYVGAPLDDAVAEDSGAVYTFVRAAGSYRFFQIVRPGDNVAAQQQFGEGIAADNEFLVIGADCDLNDMCSSKIYIYRRTADGLEFFQLLDAGMRTNLGNRLALVGDRLFSGEPSQNAEGRLNGGRMNIFIRGADGQFELEDEINHSAPSGFGAFGERFASDGEWLVVSSRDFGATEVFRRSGSDWNNVSDDQPDVVAITPRITFARIANGVLALGRSELGQVSFFELTGSEWVSTDDLSGPNGFGVSGDFDAGAIAIGNTSQNSPVGVFEAIGGDWTQTETLTSAPAGRGREVVLTPELLVVANEDNQTVSIQLR